MTRKSVESSMIASVGYDADKQILEVEFKRGGVYQYANVPAAVYSAVMAAQSIGSYFAANIKNSFEFTKV